MSARGYEVVIRLKDSPLLKQLQRMEQEGVRLGTAMGGIPTKQFDVLTKQLPAQTGLLQKIFSGGVGQLLKLTAIGAGVGGLVALMQKSSGILSGVFKLWEVGIMLMIKPIADFIGLLLRPISLLLLTNAIIPWYRYLQQTLIPISKDLGELLKKLIVGEPLLVTTQEEQELLTKISEGGERSGNILTDIWNAVIAFTQLFSGVPGLLGGLGQGIPNIQLDIGKLFAFATEGLQKSWDQIIEFFTNAGTIVQGTLLNAWNNITMFFGNAWAWVISGGQLAWNTIANFFSTAGATVSNVLFEAWNTIANFFGDVWAAVVSTLQPAWNTIVTTFSQIASTIQQILAKIQQLLSSIGLGGGGPKAPTRTGGRQFGGMITEPELTFGLRTGRFGIQGEAGPEAITPLSQMSKSFTINMNIGGIVDTVNLAHERAKLRTQINAIADTL